MPSDHTNPSAQRNSSSIPFRTIVYYHSGLTTSPISNNNRPKPLDNMQDFSFKRFCADTAALVNVSITPSSVAFPLAIFLSPIRFSFVFFCQQLKRSSAVHELHQSGLRWLGKRVNQKEFTYPSAGAAVDLSSIWLGEVRALKRL